MDLSEDEEESVQIFSILDQVKQENEEEYYQNIRTKDQLYLPSDESDDDEIDELKEKKRSLMLPQSSISNYFSRGTQDRTSKPVSFITVSELNHGSSSNQSLFRPPVQMSMISVSHPKLKSEFYKMSSLRSTHQTNQDKIQVRHQDDVCITEERTITRKLSNDYPSNTSNKLNLMAHSTQAHNANQDLSSDQQSQQHFTLQNQEQQKQADVHFPLLMNNLSDNGQQPIKVGSSNYEIQHDQSEGELINHQSEEDFSMISLEIANVPEKHQCYSTKPKSLIVTDGKSTEHYQYGYDCIDYCMTTLQYGVKGKKFHYTQKKNDHCTITLSSDGLELSWLYYGKQSSSKKKGFCSLIELRGVGYGSNTLTFSQYREDIQRSVKSKNNELFHYYKKKNQDPFALAKSPTTFKGDLLEEPFYSWQCVSLYFRTRTIDFVIEDDIELYSFLNYMQFVAFENNKREIQEEKMGIVKKLSTMKVVPIIPKLVKEPSPETYKKLIPMKYFRLMKIKMKIAHEALVHGQTIAEFIINAILKTFFEQLNDESHLGNDDSFFSMRKIFRGKFEQSFRVAPFEESQHMGEFVKHEQQPDFQLQLKKLPNEDSLEMEEEIKEDSKFVAKQTHKFDNNFEEITDQDRNNLVMKKIQSVGQPLIEKHFSPINPLYGQSRIDQISLKESFKSQRDYNMEPTPVLSKAKSAHQLSKFNRQNTSSNALKGANVPHDQDFEKSSNQLLKTLTNASQQHLLTKLDNILEFKERRFMQALGQVDEIPSNHIVAKVRSNFHTDNDVSLVESNKAKIKRKLQDIQRLELIMKLIAKRRYEEAENPKQIKTNSPSVKFYEGFNVFKLKRVCDMKEILSQNFLSYIGSNKNQLQNLNDQRSFLFRKNITILARKENMQKKSEGIQSPTFPQDEEPELKKTNSIKSFLSSFSCIKKLSNARSKKRIKSRGDGQEQEKETAAQKQMKLAMQSDDPNAFMKQDTKVKSFLQAVKKAEDKQKSPEEIRLDQIRIKQMISLKAKGFFLDNVAGAVESEPNKRSREDNSSSVNPNSGNSSKTMTKKQKLALLKLQLQQNSNQDFNQFLAEYNNAKKPGTKSKILQEKLDHEQQYFNPILSQLGQMRLVRALQKNKTVTKGKTLPLEKQQAL